MKLKVINYYGFDHALVNKRFSGDLTFINSFSVNSEYLPSAVYRAAKPDKSKGHKEFMLITKDFWSNSGSYVVRGMTKREISKHAKRDGLQCLICNEVIFSTHRHGLIECECSNTFIDGGTDYCRFGSEKPNSVVGVKIDLLTGKIK